MTTQKYYIAACWNPLDTRVPTLLIDADNENGTYYRCSDVDPELARLRELCAEHETCVADHNLKDIELSRLRERVEGLEASGNDKLILLENEARHREHFEEQCKLLLEAVRWCLSEGIFVPSVSDRHVRLGHYYCAVDMQFKEPPAHLAPLIAEAGKPDSEPDPS